MSMQGDISDEEVVDDPDDIERVIEADADVHHGSDRGSENEERKSGGEEPEKKVKVRRKLGPRPTLNAQRLKGPRGLGVIESFFSDIKLQGKGNEREDLDLIMGRLEHWVHRLYPRMQFDEAIKKIEQLGTKKDVSNYVKRIRLGMEEDPVIETEVIEDTPDSPPPLFPEEDSFDQLIASSVVPPQPASTEITAEQRERMLQNRLLAEERRNARIKRAQELKQSFLAKQAQKQQQENAGNLASEADVGIQGNSISGMEQEGHASISGAIVEDQGSSNNEMEAEGHASISGTIVVDQVSSNNEMEAEGHASISGTIVVDQGSSNNEMEAEGHTSVSGAVAGNHGSINIEMEVEDHTSVSGTCAEIQGSCNNEMDLEVQENSKSESD